jgi:hypothetical protein
MTLAVLMKSENLKSVGHNLVTYKALKSEDNGIMIVVGLEPCGSMAAEQ